MPGAGAAGIIRLIVAALAVSAGLPLDYTGSSCRVTGP